MSKHGKDAFQTVLHYKSFVLFPVGQSNNRVNTCPVQIVKNVCCSNIYVKHVSNSTMNFQNLHIKRTTTLFQLLLWRAIPNCRSNSVYKYFQLSSDSIDRSINYQVCSIYSFNCFIKCHLFILNNLTITIYCSPHTSSEGYPHGSSVILQQRIETLQVLRTNNNLCTCYQGRHFNRTTARAEKESYPFSSTRALPLCHQQLQESCIKKFVKTSYSQHTWCFDKL